MPSNFFTKDLLSGKNMHIEDYSYGKPRVFDWDDGGSLFIGKFCSIADDVTILLGGNHRIDWISTYPFGAISDVWSGGLGVEGHPWSKGDVVIGNDVWIGNGATILSGVKIGNGAVIGARAVVAKDVPPYSIVVGNPSKMIKTRFDKKTIKLLENIQWWNWPIEFINSNIKYLCSGDIKKIIEASNNLKGTKYV